MRYILLLVSVLFIADVFSKDTIKWENDGPEIKVKASGLFSKTEAPKFMSSKDAPSGSYARALAVDHYKFQWRPRWNFVGMGGAILPFVLESSDNSALGIVETLPQKDAPASSIIVFMNLHKLQVNNYVVMTGKDVRKFCFIPFSSNIVCLIKSPYDKYDPKPKFQLQTMDTHIDMPVSTSPVFKNEITAFCCSGDGSKLFVAFKDSNKIRIYDTNELEKSFTTLKTVNNPIALSCSKDGKRLLVTGHDKIQVFNIEQQPIPEKTINLPQYFHPDKIVLCSDNASSFLVSLFGEDTYFYSNERFTKICKRTDADVNWSSTDQRILIGLPQKSTVAIYSTSDLENPQNQFRYQKIRPKTNGKLHKIISLPTRGGAVLILDKRGTLARLYPKRHRWSKEIIINEPSPR